MAKAEEKARVIGYLPQDNPPPLKLLAFAIQHVIVMFPATVLVAILTGFDISVTLVASGLATLCFLFITRKRIPLYYGSSFSYIAAVGSVVRTAGVRAAQAGIVASGLVSIAAGYIIKKFGKETISKVLPPAITGSVAIVIGLTLADDAILQASDNWTLSLITLFATVLFSVYLRGTLGQLSILLGVVVGYVVSLFMGVVDFSGFSEVALFQIPKFTLPQWNWNAVFAIMPIAIATIPESTAHLYQIDLYVNNLAERVGRKPQHRISGLLGENLIGDGIGDMVAGAIGGPAGTNYGENTSLMAITRNFSISSLIVAALISILVGFFGYLAAFVNTIPQAVIGGVSVYLFGVIGAQGVALMIAEKVSLFKPASLAVTAMILVIGIGGSFFGNVVPEGGKMALFSGNIPIFGMELPAIATAAIVGILLNLVFVMFKPAEEKDN
ncbi:MAG: uracil-xanthine permease family protein [Limnochordia bacterium]